MAVSKTCVDLDSYQSKQLCGIWRQICFEMFFGSFCIRPKCIVSKMIRCLSGFSTFYPWMIYRKRKRKSIRSLLYRKNRLKYSEGISWKMRNSTLHPSKFVLSWKLNVNEYLRVNRCPTSTSTAQRKYYFWWYWSSTSLFFLLLHISRDTFALEIYCKNVSSVLFLNLITSSKLQILGFKSSLLTKSLSNHSEATLWTRPLPCPVWTTSPGGGGLHNIVLDINYLPRPGTPSSCYRPLDKDQQRYFSLSTVRHKLPLEMAALKQICNINLINFL